jgi:hypothetical protein
VLTLEQAINLLSRQIGANLDAAQRINEVCERYLVHGDPPGSIELVTFVVTTDANGQGFITLPTRYQAMRGVVKNTDSTQLCGWPLHVQNGFYQFLPGNLGMIKYTLEQAGVLLLPKSAPTDPVKYKVPVCAGVGTLNYFTCVCKLAFQMLENDTDPLPISNIGALKLGLKAIAKEEAEDQLRANQYWAEGEVLLAKQKDNETGAESYGKIQFEDDYALACLNESYGWYEGGWGYWGVG